MLHEALQLVHHNNFVQYRDPQQHQQRMSHSNRARNLHASLSDINGTQKHFGSSVAVHKLRESKWFTHNECNILLSVVETGFILEKKTVPENDATHQWGIALWKAGQEKSKNEEHLTIYSLVFDKNKPKLLALKLQEFWLEQSEIRINNQNDKVKPANTEEEVRKQIEFGKKNKNIKWHNSQHFAYWCRYEKSTQGRVQQISERVKWNNIGVSIGMLMMKSKTRRTTIN